MKLKYPLLFLLVLFISCNTEQTVVIKPESPANTRYSADKKIISKKEQLIRNYRGSNTIRNNLINTELHISFNIRKKQATGHAVITLHPHFYPTDSVILDAQEFDIYHISLVSDNEILPLAYNYKDNKIKIKLNKTYTRNDTFKIFVDYTANPEKVKSGGSEAIHDNKGLYFINPDSDKPQIWTQGETQSNSCWFPTIDSPNQKMTQDFYISVKNDFISLSNGILISSVPNSDSTHTDYWRQTKPHAPYLAMIACGKFSVIKDYWRDIPLKVFVDEGKEDQAKKVFGKTDKMIDFYSKILNYDFPWDKYSQIIVKDFVSGAMENTGAVVFGSYVLNFGNEHQRIENESIVAHELSHHWFGDLVTCESWANLPLNESFATYFEYLWIEHEYGRFEADDHLDDDFMQYNAEHYEKDVNLIRFYYTHRDNMFDAHSYQKGGMILHMLRYTVGDDAFFKALHLYLKNNEYKTAEIHNLRLAFEEVTGEDMNWFFNEWFLNKGIPLLDINYFYNPETKHAGLNISQNQNLKTNPLYKIPTSVDLYFKDTVINKKIILNKQYQTVDFPVKEKPLFLNFDPENAILCKKTENYTYEQYIDILEKSPLYEDKNEAFYHLKDYKSHRKNEICFKLLNHPYWKFRYKAVAGFNSSVEKDSILTNKFIDQLKKMSENDKNTSVRNLAVLKLNSIQK